MSGEMYNPLNAANIVLWWINYPNCHNAIAGKVGHSSITWEFEHQMASKRLSKQDRVQVVGTDLGSKAWANMFCWKWKFERYAA